MMLAFKAGNGEANHNDLDSGSFVLEMGGQQWAIDLGSDSYGLPGYFDKSSAHGKRYSYYRKSTAGHNTLTFNNNGDSQPGWCDQSMLASEVSTFSEAGGGHGPFAIVNMTAAYAKQGGPSPPSPPAGLVLRGLALSADYQQLYIVDEFDFKAAANVTWALHTRANVTVGTGGTADGGTDDGGASGLGPAAMARARVGAGVGHAELRIGGDVLFLDVLEPPANTAADADANDTPQEPAFVLSAAPAPHLSPPQHATTGLNKVKVVAKPDGTSRIVVRLSQTPLTGPPPIINPLSQWDGKSPFAAGHGGALGDEATQSKSGAL
jgi:hypothetical protein